MTKLVKIPLIDEPTITLPKGIDFRKPGQLDPWRAKEFRERSGQVNLGDLLGGLAQQQQFTGNPQNDIRAQAQASAQSQFGSPFGFIWS